MNMDGVVYIFMCISIKIEVEKGNVLSSFFWGYICFQFGAGVFSTTFGAVYLFQFFRCKSFLFFLICKNQYQELVFLYQLVLHSWFHYALIITIYYLQIESSVVLHKVLLYPQFIHYQRNGLQKVKRVSLFLLFGQEQQLELHQVMLYQEKQMKCMDGEQYIMYLV